MFQALKITGVEGQVRWVYSPAIIFGPWSITAHGSAGTLTAQIVSVNEFRVRQHPLVVVVPAGRAEWRWTVRDLQISGSTLTATLERQE